MAKRTDGAITSSVLGIEYLDEGAFTAAISDPKFHRSLPYTLQDVVHQITQFIEADSSDPRGLFEVYKTFPPKEWLVIVNHTINEALKKKELAGAGKK